MTIYLCVHKSELVSPGNNLMLIADGQRINLNLKSVDLLKEKYQVGDALISRNPIASAICEAAMIPYTTDYRTKVE